MRSHCARSSWRRLPVMIAVSSAVVALSACGDSPLAPIVTDSPTHLSIGDAADAKAPQVDICHAVGNGSYRLITVNGNAVPAHVAHGDALLGDPAFDENCVPQSAGVSGVWVQTGLPPDLSITLQLIEDGTCFFTYSFGGSDILVPCTYTLTDSPDGRVLTVTVEDGTGAVFTGLFDEDPLVLTDEFGTSAIYEKQ